MNDRDKAPAGSGLDVFQTEREKAGLRDPLAELLDVTAPGWRLAMTGDVAAIWRAKQRAVLAETVLSALIRAGDGDAPCVVAEAQQNASAAVYQADCLMLALQRRPATLAEVQARMADLLAGGPGSDGETVDLRTGEVFDEPTPATPPAPERDEKDRVDVLNEHGVPMALGVPRYDARSAVALNPGWKIRELKGPPQNGVG